MKITDALKGEHGVFYAQFKFIENTLPDANLSTLQFLGAMLAAALVPHAMMENEILFPIIETKIGEGGPTRVMRMEHEAIEGKLADLEELKGNHGEIEGALAKLPQSASAEHAREMLKDILFAAREHFMKEENVLFPMTEQMIDTRTLEQMGTQWAQRRGVALV